MTTWRPLSPPSAADSRLARLAVVTRGEAVESVHHGVAVAVDAAGRSIASCGDGAYPIVVRSAVKPFQLLPVVLSGAADAFALEPAELALACSSHSGTAGHVARARAMLAKGGLDSEHLGCGVHRPFDAASAAALERAGHPPSALHNNCSGKHAAMLLACAHERLPLVGYLDFDHPHQRRIAAEIAACSGREREGLAPAAVDGCSAPTFVLTALELARAFAALASPEAAGLGRGRARALERIAGAMALHPDMVAGPERFTTALIEATGGRVLGKEGAEGVYGVAVRGPQPCGVAVKIADGGERARDTVVLDLLAQLGALSGAEQRLLAPFYRPVLRNHREVATGEIVAELELRSPD